MAESAQMVLDGVAAPTSWRRPRQCEACGNAYTPSKRRQRYCSPACHANRYRATRQPRAPRDCPVCSTTFTPVVGHHVYCSRQCSVAAHRASYGESDCAVCGGRFQKIRGNHIYCGTECRKKALRLPALEPRLCESCGKSYAPRTRAQRLCSRGCRSPHRARQPCAHCGKPFTPINRQHKHCSTECRAEAVREMGYRQTAHEAKPCENCRETFTPRTATQRYCSANCRNGAKRKNGARALCLECDSPFDARSGRHRFCSPKCQLTNLRRRQRNAPEGTPEKPCAVYVFGATRHIKVGISARPERRLAGFNGANPEPMKLLHLSWFDSRYAAHGVEAAVMRCAEKYRLGGEHFDSRATQAVIAAISALETIS